MRDIKENRVEQIIIKPSHPKYKTLDEMCLRSKNLYNEANYVIRQEFIKNGNYINYYDMNREFKTHENYKLNFSQPSNCTLRRLDKNWKSYFRAIKDWKKHPEKYLGMPRLPNYLPKDGRFPWMIPNNLCYYKPEKGTVYIKCRMVNDYEWKSKCLGRLIQVRFIPHNGYITMEIVYEIEIENKDLESNRIAAIDIGVDNLITMSNNIGEKPLIINGKIIKSINQNYNRQKAKIQSELMKCNGQSWSKKLDYLTFKRYQRIKNYMHNTSAMIIKWCVEHDIDTLVVGKNDTWKQEKKGMQNFIFIPYEMLLGQLDYKCKDTGIKYIETNEAYTSGTSYLDDETPTKENYNKDRRIQRGLFQAKDMLINADVNGSLQIMRKVFPDSYTGYGIEVDLTPVIVNAI
mgnify:FL=1